MEKDIRSLVAAIDEELSKLEQVRRILTGVADSGAKTNHVRKSGTRHRPKLSAEGRARIAAAQRKRWAKHRKAAKKQPVAVA